MKEQLTKLFKSKGIDASHIWLEGDRLVESGFAIGTEYHQYWYKHRLLLVTNSNLIQSVEDLQKTVTRVVVASGDAPAIRIEGQRVLLTFGKEYGYVKAVFTPGMIEITGHDVKAGDNIRRTVAAQEPAHV